MRCSRHGDEEFDSGIIPCILDKRQVVLHKFGLSESQKSHIALDLQFGWLRHIQSGQPPKAFGIKEFSFWFGDKVLGEDSMDSVLNANAVRNDGRTSCTKRSEFARCSIGGPNFRQAADSEQFGKDACIDLVCFDFRVSDRFCALRSKAIRFPLESDQVSG